jgi:hypothetical protein
MRDASLSSPRTWPDERRACVLPCVSAGTWGRRAATTRLGGWHGSRRRSSDDRGRRPRKCRLRSRNARSGRSDGRRSPEPRPVTFLDTGSVSGDAPPRSVASITAMTRKARGCLPRAFALSAARSSYPTTRPPPTTRRTAPGADLPPGPPPACSAAGSRSTAGALPQSSAPLAPARLTRPAHRLSTGGHRLPVSPRAPLGPPAPGRAAAAPCAAATTTAWGSSDLRIEPNRSGAGRITIAPPWRRSRAPLKWEPVPGDPADSGTHGARR